MENKYYTQYKGWWYKYIPRIKDIPGFINVWRISDQQDEMGWVYTFNADLHRIDQCFDIIFNEKPIMGTDIIDHFIREVEKVVKNIQQEMQEQNSYTQKYGPKNRKVVMCSNEERTPLSHIKYYYNEE